ncbi:hypothetical protein ZHAS_00000572 [Anopheles sinensis]|uniref:Uncharacterized protein n=1 Tax=Anopheles sinensis TaxID=74873 RepID=A0A084VA96_ANOSI|nr:hypothetical protein ZHAS_00000572 [Anopheles sinensis]
MAYGCIRRRAVVVLEIESTVAGEVKPVHPHDALQRGMVLSTNATIHGEGGLSKRYRFFYIVPR